MRRARQGYTLVELLVTVAVVVIVLGTGYPVVQALLREAHLSGMVSSYLQAFNSARVIALTAHRQVAVCTLDSRGRCSGRWASELAMFYDDDRDGVLASPDDIISLGGAPRTREVDVTFRAFRTTRHVSLRPNGQYRQNGTFRFCPRDGSPGRAIVINVAGRARTEKIACRR